jgi:hypothetical protein
MPWSFLNPWFLLGALAVAAPLWLHLRRRVETNRRLFSTLRFLDDSPRPRSSPLRLRDVLLFLLRTAALFLVVATFAWPYRRDQGAAPVRESRVYILDSTLSHQANGAFDRARARLLNDLAQAGSDVQVAIVELKAQPRLMASFGDGQELARQMLRGATPSFQRGSYLAAFRLAHSLLANSLGERKRIIFYSDNQENQWTDHVTVPPFLQQIEVEVLKPAVTNAPNLAVSEPRLQRIFLGDKSLVHFTVNLTHSGPAQRGRVSLQVNRQTMLRQTVELPVLAGTLTLQGQWEADPAQWAMGEVRVEGEPDALSADNRVFFSVPPVREGKVALLAQSPYLRVALSPEVMRGQWATRVLEPARLAEELAAGQDSEVLVIESAYLQSTHARQLVERYLANQGGVFLVVNRLTLAVRAALRDLGFEAESASTTAPPTPERVRYFFSNHPIFHPFLSPEYGNLLDVRIDRCQRLRPVQGLPLMFSESGQALFFQGTKFAGRLFVLAFGLERDQTSWPSQVSFVPFLDLCLQNARPGDSTPLDHEPGALSVLSFPTHSTVREVVLRDDQRELQRAPVLQGKAMVRLPALPGAYALTYDQATVPERILTVNPSPKESVLQYLAAPPALKLWRSDLAGAKPRPPPAPVQGWLSLASILQQRLWWWCLVAALAALLGETIWTTVRRKGA